MRIAKALWLADISAEYSHQESPKFKRQLDEVLERQIPFMVCTCMMCVYYTIYIYIGCIKLYLCVVLYIYYTVCVKAVCIVLLLLLQHGIQQYFPLNFPLFSSYFRSSLASLNSKPAP